MLGLHPPDYQRALGWGVAVAQSAAQSPRQVGVEVEDKADCAVRVSCGDASPF